MTNFVHLAKLNTINLYTPLDTPLEQNQRVPSLHKDYHFSTKAIPFYKDLLCDILQTFLISLKYDYPFYNDSFLSAEGAAS